MTTNATDNTLPPYDKLTELITCGYIREIESLFPLNIPYYQVPLPITYIILSYINNYFSNSGCYKWKIYDNNIIQNMLNAKIGDKWSQPFIISNLNWRLDVYPNGTDNETKGCLIHLRLLSLPIAIESITFCRIFRVVENMSGSSWINTLSIDEYDFWSTKCPLAELIQLNCKTITILIELNIFKVQLNKYNIEEII
eukprot:185265_1